MQFLIELKSGLSQMVKNSKDPKLGAQEEVTFVHEYIDAAFTSE